MEIQKCFEILDVEPGITRKEFKRVYRDLVDVWHPDRFSHNERLRKKAEEKLRQVNLAYQTVLESDRQIELFSGRQPFANEKRIYARNPCDLMVDYLVPGQLMRASFDIITNISASGVFIKTDRHMQIGQKISMNFSLPRFGRLMNVTGKIARHCTNGVGVQFTISPTYRKFISNFV